VPLSTEINALGAQLTAAQVLARAAAEGKKGGKKAKKKGKKGKKGKAASKGRGGNGGEDEKKLPSRVLAIRTQAQSMKNLEAIGAFTTTMEKTPLERCEMNHLAAIDDLGNELKLMEKPQYAEMFQYVLSVCTGAPLQQRKSSQGSASPLADRKPKKAQKGSDEPPLILPAEIAFCGVLIGHLRRLAHLPLDVAIGAGDNKRKPMGGKQAKPGGRRPAAKKTPAKPRVITPPVSDKVLAQEALAKRLLALHGWFLKEQQRLEQGRPVHVQQVNPRRSFSLFSSSLSFRSLLSPSSQRLSPLSLSHFILIPPHQVKQAKGQVAEGAEVYVWCAYDPRKSRMATGWYRGQVRTDGGDGTYDVQMLRGDRRVAPRR
jgi:hypothetical protein